MKVYRQLVRTFLRSGDMEDPKQKKQKLFYALLGAISALFIMIPMCLLMGYLAYAFTFGMGGNGNGFLFIVHFIGLFSAIFGINVILNVFYFAGDIPFILPLPIAPYKVIAAKFTTAYINESVMQVMILISAVIGFLIGAESPWWMVPISLVGVVTLPIAPLAYCGILCVIVMGATNWIKNKAYARRISMVLTLIVIAAGVYGVTLLGDLDMTRFTEELLAGNVAFVNAMNIAFPTNYWLIDAMANKHMLSFVWYILGNVVLLAIFLGLAQLLYFKGLIGVTGSSDGSKRKKKTGALKMKKPCKPLVAYFKKEWKILFKTPAFFLNCIVVNVLWPILGYVIVMLQSNSSVLTDYVTLYQIGDEFFRWVAILIVVVVTVLLAAANSIASSAITREGKYYYVMKYIPIAYRDQLKVKSWISMAISGIFAVIYIVVASVVLDVDNLSSFYYILISLLCVAFVTYFGLYLDTVNPKLAWDDELNALRGNTNVFFNMAYSMIIAVVFVAVMLLVYKFTLIPLWVMQIVLVGMLLVGNWLMMRLCYQKGEENLEALY